MSKRLVTGNNLRICLLANAATLHTQRWASYLVQKGHDIHVISLEPSTIPGARVYRVQWWPRVKELGYLVALPRILQLMRKIRPDILHAHYAISYGVLAALTRYKPLVITAWGSDVLVSPGTSRVRWAVLAWALRRAELVTSLSLQITQLLMKAGVTNDRILTMPFGVDPQVFRCPPLQAARPIDIICTRNLDDIYNLQLLLRALPLVLKRQPTLKCVLAGDGPRRDSLKSLAKSLGVDRHVQWVGRVSSGALAVLLQRSKVYVSPSLSDGTSTALTEAMACGCFPVATDIPANRPWIENGKTGFLIPIDKPDLLADRILFSLESDELRNTASDTNAERVLRDANWFTNMERIDEQYSRIAGEARRSAAWGRKLDEVA